MIKETKKDKVANDGCLSAFTDKIIRFNPYTCGKRFYIRLGNTPGLERKCHEFTSIIVGVLKDLKWDFSVLNPKFYIVRFERYTDIEAVTDRIKKTMQTKIKNGRIKKVSIKNLCIVFPNNNFIIIDLINGKKEGIRVF